MSILSIFESAAKRQQRFELACRVQDLRTVEELFRKGVSLEAADESGNTPLMNASRAGSSEIVVCLLAAGADLRARRKDRLDALMMAVSGGFAKVVALLMDAGADALAPSMGDASPLKLALSLKAADVSRTITERVPVGALSRDGNHPLAYCCWAGDHELVDLLLMRGADPNLPSGAKRLTPLMIAAMADSPKAIRALANRGADPCALDADGLSALDYAKNSEATSAILSHWSPDRTDTEGRTLLMTASAGGRVSAVDFLLSNGAKGNDRDNEGLTALHHAVKKKQVAVVRRLMAAGVDPEVKDNAGHTSLMWATHAHSTEIQQALEEGAKVPLSDCECMLCGRSRRDVHHLISGPWVFVCDSCVEVAVWRVMKVEFHGPAHSMATIQVVGPAATSSRDLPCVLCGQSCLSKGLFLTWNDARKGECAFCATCLGLMVEILADKFGERWKEQERAWQRFVQSDALPDKPSVPVPPVTSAALAPAITLKKCDICGADVPGVNMTVVAGSRLRHLTGVGWLPSRINVDSAAVAYASRSGISERDLKTRKWHMSLQTYGAGDYGLCRTCAAEVFSAEAPKGFHTES